MGSKSKEKENDPKKKGDKEHRKELFTRHMSSKFGVLLFDVAV